MADPLALGILPEHVVGQLLPLLKLFLELEVEAEGFGIDLVEVGQEVAAEVLVVLVQGF